MAENVARGLVSTATLYLQGVIGGRIPIVPFFRFQFYLLILLSSLIHLLLTRARREVEGEEVDGRVEDRDLKLHFWVGWCF
jgi:hypothetical protein